jgi:hypothetical protein
MYVIRDKLKYRAKVRTKSQLGNTGFADGLHLKLERLYTDFFKIYNEHYEDLKLYALYHRNVNIQNCNQDPTSVLFFAWNKKKVFGFKEYELIEDEQEL